MIPLAEDPVPLPQIVDDVLLLAVQPGGRREDKELQSVGHPANLLERAQPWKRLFPGALRTSADYWHPTLAVELTGFGVAVAAVEPGNYKSQIAASMVKRMRAKGYSPEKDSRYGSMLELVTGSLDRSHYQDPDDVAQATLGPQGGFAGKFETYRELKVDAENGGQFEVVLPLESFKRQKECYPESAAGLELFDCWILTVEEDAGLEIVSVALY